MTDETPQQEEPAENLDSQEPEVQPDIDSTLAGIVRLANIGIEQDVTLFVGGIMVTGLVVSGRRYFEGAAAALDKANVAGTGGEQLRDDMKSAYLDKANVYVKPGEIPEGHREPTPAYIHLYNAKWLVGGQFTTQRGLYWRGRLTRIDAFVMGGAANN